MNLGCRLIRIGGIENHIHMLIELHPDQKLTTLVRNVKANSSGWLRRDMRFVDFDGWATGYFAITVSPSGQQGVVDYISNQVEHHKGKSFKDELVRFHNVVGIEYDERDMM